MKYSIAVWLALCPSIVWGATFGVDFDRVTMETQPGFTSSLQGLDTSSERSSLVDTRSFTRENNFPNALGPGKDVGYVFSGNRRVARGTISSGPFVGQSALLGDFWGTRGTLTTGDPLAFDIRLDIPSGEYTLTTYHHDILEGTTGLLNITDAEGLHPALPVVETTGNAPLAIGMVTTTIRSNGVDTVWLNFVPASSTGTGVGSSFNYFGINGFMLEEVLATPEPTSVVAWLVAAMLVCGLVARQRRWRQG